VKRCEGFSGFGPWGVCFCQAIHALTIKLDQSDEAAQLVYLAVEVKRQNAKLVVKRPANDYRE